MTKFLNTLCCSWGRISKSSRSIARLLIEVEEEFVRLSSTMFPSAYFLFSFYFELEGLCFQIASFECSSVDSIDDQFSIAEYRLSMYRLYDLYLFKHIHNSERIVYEVFVDAEIVRNIFLLYRVLGGLGTKFNKLSVES